MFERTAGSNPALGATIVFPKLPHRGLIAKWYNSAILDLTTLFHVFLHEWKRLVPVGTSNLATAGRCNATPIV